MIRNLLRFIGWRHVWRRPVRTALTIIGIAVGVGLFVAISAINESTLDFFRTNVGSMTGKATFTILGPEGGFGEENVEIARTVPGVKSAVPMIETQARHVGAKTLVVLGIDLLQESAVRDYRSDGTQEDVVEDPLEFLNQEDSIIITKTFAAEHGLALESTLDLVTALGKKRFTVRGLLDPSGPAKAYGGGIAIMDIDGARVMFGKEGKVDRIDIVPKPGVDEAELAQRIQTAVGSGLRVERKENQVRALSRMVEGYQGILAFFSMLALLIGMFLVANTVSIAVADRRREIAVLRAIGASRTGVLVMFVIEAALMGVIGAAIGVLLGRGLAELLVERVSASMSRQYVTPIDVSEIHFSAAHAVAGIVAGTFAAMIAALWPAWQATRVHGGEAFGAGPAGAQTTKPATRRTMILRLSGLAMLASFGALALLGPLPPPLEALKPLLGVLGAVLGAPLLVALALRALARVVDARGPLGRFVVLRLACQNLLRHPSRTGGNVLSLVIGLMLVVTMAVIQHSFKESISTWNARTLRSDLWVSSIGRVLTIDVQPLADTIATELDQVPGVDVAGGKGARGFRIVHHVHERRQIIVKAYDPTHPRIGTSLFDVVDRPVDAAVKELYDAAHPGVIVSQNFAAHFKKQTGDMLALDTPSGRQELKIIATAADYGSPEGTLILAREVYQRLWRDPLVTGFSVEVRPGATVDSVRAEIDLRFGPRGLIATPNHELSKQFDEVMDESFGYTKAIEIAALAIGLLGLLGTLLVSLLARERELGVLRAIGLSRSQLARMILGEAVLLGLFGGVIAAALGVYIAKLWVVSTLASSLGWFIQVHVPLVSVAVTVGTGLFVGLVVGLLCAWRVSSLEIRNALESS